MAKILDGHYYYNTYNSISKATRAGQLLEKANYLIRLEIVKEYDKPVYRIYTYPEISQKHQLKMQVKDIKELAKYLKEED